MTTTILKGAFKKCYIYLKINKVFNYWTIGRHAILLVGMFLIYCNLVMPYGNIDRDQYWL